MTPGQILKAFQSRPHVTYTAPGREQMLQMMNDRATRAALAARARQARQQRQG